jgi:hypothetical protein
MTVAAAMVHRIQSHFTPFYLSFLSRHTQRNSAKPKSNHKPTTYPTKYLCQYLADEDISSHHSLRMYGGQTPVLNVVWLYIFTVMGLAVHGEAAKHTKKLTFYAIKISR